MDLFESQQIELLKNLGTQIKLLRVEQNMSEKELGEKVGLSEHDIQTMEEGKRVLDLDVIENIAKELGLSLEQLFELASQL